MAQNNMQQEKKNSTMDNIEEFAKEHNVPVYGEMPEGFHIMEGAMTAPPGAKWITDDAPVLEKKRGLLLDKEMIRLLQSHPKEEEVSIVGYYMRQRDGTQYIHYAIGENQYLTTGVCIWSDKIQERLATFIPMDEKAFDLQQMEKYLREFYPYGKLENHVKQLLEEENRKMERRKTADQPKEESLLQERSRKHDEKHKIG